ncbi:MAG TPA: Hsp20/alpha crystallin family protein [Alphaproteobacteria bacterium]|nr:Hsp20/alpha crystallin family protein [Alphaproteobacteria bacterium]
MWPNQEFGRLGFDPFAEFRRLQNEINRAFSGFTAAAATREFPPVNIWLGENSVAVTAELPGVGPENVDISLQGDMLTLRGERKPDSTGGASWHRQERTYGRFTRAVQLPFRVDADKVNAQFNNGVLEIELTRPETDKPRKISVQAH